MLIGLSHVAISCESLTKMSKLVPQLNKLSQESCIHACQKMIGKSHSGEIGAFRQNHPEHKFVIHDNNEQHAYVSNNMFRLGLGLLVYSL